VDYLSRSEREELSDTYSYLSNGQSVRCNHNTSDCSGSSNSMLIRRDDNGALNFKCYRCGSFGRDIHYAKVALKSKLSGEGGTTEPQDANRSREIPSDAEGDITAWPSAARVWLRRYGITDKEIVNAKIVYSADLGRLVLPVYDLNGLASYQTRGVHKHDTAPKYLTVRNRDAPNVHSDGKSASTIVLVEDTISGIKVSRYFPTLVLNGTNLQDYQLKYIISGNYSQFYVWLDDDNPIVQKNALKIKRTLDKLGTCTVIHTEGKDPKEHTDVEIQEILS
jgi:hypothetical protein